MAATKKRAPKKSSKKFTAMSGFKTSMSGLSGFRKKGKNATKDGVNVTFDEIVHYAQKDMEKRDGVKPSLEMIKKTAYYIFGAIADNLSKGDKVCVSAPELGSFKTTVRKYSIGGKSGKTKTVKFTPNSAFKENAKLGRK